MSERKYAMTRLGPGDYLLPSNDAKTLWRITRYEEDGSAIYVNADGSERPLTGMYWMTWKYKRPLDSGEALNMDEFVPWDLLLPTRAAAIRAALR